MEQRHFRHLTMRLSEAWISRRQTKPFYYPNHRLPPWLIEDATGNRSNRLLDSDKTTPAFALCKFSRIPRAQPKLSRKLGTFVAARLANRCHSPTKVPLDQM